MRPMGDDDGIPTMELSTVDHCESDDLPTSREEDDNDDDGDDGPASARKRNAAEDSTAASGWRQSTVVAIVNDAHVVVALNSAPTGHSLLAVADLDDGDVPSGYAKKLSCHARRPEDHSNIVGGASLAHNLPLDLRSLRAR